MKKVAVILVNYKTYVNKYLDECRDSLRAQDYPADLIKTYVVDNAASDESMKYIAEHYPEAIIVPRPDGNYAAANNAGIKKGIEDGCEYFVIANMDVKYDSSWLSELVKGFENNENVGFVQSKVLLYPQTPEEWQKPRINTLGNIMHYLGFGFTSHYRDEDMQIDGYPEITGYASGCSFLTSKEVLEKIGLYDEEYYMYHDDVEMSWRAKLAGYKIILAPKSIIFHKYEFSRSVLMIMYMERNRYMAMYHYYKLPTIILFSPMILMMEGGMFFYSLVNKWFGAKYKAMSYFWKPSNWKKIIEKRKLVRGLRVVSDRQIIKHFSGRVLYQEIDNPILRYIVNPVMHVYFTLAKLVIFW